MDADQREFQRRLPRNVGFSSCSMALPGWRKKNAETKPTLSHALKSVSGKTPRRPPLAQPLFQKQPFASLRAKPLGASRMADLGARVTHAQHEPTQLHQTHVSSPSHSCRKTKQKHFRIAQYHTERCCHANFCCGVWHGFEVSNNKNIERHFSILNTTGPEIIWQSSTRKNVFSFGLQLMCV